MFSDTQNKSTAEPVQVVLLGASGSGKSSSGNTILGKKCFRSEVSGKSVTCHCQIKSETINGRQVTVVDTPGWDCTELSKNQIKSQIKETLRNLQGPYSFLLVLHVGRVEFMKYRDIYNLSKIIGPSYLDHTTILFTHSDDLEFKTFDEFVKEGEKEFQDLLNKCSRRFYCWNNRNPKSDEDVNKLLKDLKNTEMHKSHSIKSLEASSPNSESGIKSKEPENKDIHESRSAKCSRNEDFITSSLNYEDPTKLEEAKNLQPQIKQTEIRVLFLGMNKMGKTSSIKTFLGESFDHKTPQTSVYKVTRSGLDLKLVESPGFDEKEEEIKKAITTSLSLCDPGPHVIIIVLSVSRFSPAIKKTMKIVLQKLGDEARKHLLFLFTGRDELEEKHIQSFIKENPNLTEIVERSRFHAFNNRDTTNQIQVDDLMLMIDQIYTNNDHKHFVSNKQMKKGKSWSLFGW